MNKHADLYSRYFEVVPLVYTRRRSDWAGRILKFPITVVVTILAVFVMALRWLLLQLTHGLDWFASWLNLFNREVE